MNTLHSSELDEGFIIQSLVSEEKLARKYVTNKWLELWSMYKTRPIRIREDEQWKSKLNDGRVFELVETVGAYIRNAMFFSDRWAELDSNDHEIAELLPLVSTYFCDKLNESNLKKEFRVFLTQLLLTGFSAILPYWDTENNCIAFECLNSYDVYIESSRRYSHRFSYSFREVYLNYSEFCAWVNDGLLELPNSMGAEAGWEEYKKRDVEKDGDTSYLRDVQPLSNKEEVIVIEYYCPKERTLTRTIDDEILYEETVDRCPWLIATLFNTPEDSYPLSLIDSSIGLILANNILHNRRLDNIALSIDNMWLFVDDGVTNPEDIKTAPGKIISVARPETLQPLRPPANNFNVTYEEGTVLDTKIDRNVGTGAMISANSYRQGERVTKAEIEGVKSAGGNRLTDVFEHIESEVILPLLRRALSIIAENMGKSDKVKLAANRPGVYDILKILPSDLKHSYSIKVTGTQSVINRDRNISLITDFLTLVANIPQFQNLIDYSNLYFDLLVKFGFDDPSRYMIDQTQQPQAEQQPQSPLQSASSTAEAIGGSPMANAFQQSVANGSVVSDLNSMQGLSPQTTEQMTPEQNNLATQVLTAPTS